MSGVIFQALKNLALQPIRRYAPLVGRLLIAPIFIISGLAHIANGSSTIETMQAFRFPLPYFFLGLAVIFLLAGGLSILIGFRARLGALLLILFLIPATLVFHAFWTFPQEEMQAQTIHFLKNLAIMGGLMTILQNGAGPVSIDATQGRCDRDTE